MIWIDGRLHEGTRIPFDLADRGLLLADGLFETLLVVGGVPFRLDAHLARLRAGAAVLRMPVDMAAVEQAVADLAALLGDPTSTVPGSALLPARGEGVRRADEGQPSPEPAPDPPCRARSPRRGGAKGTPSDPVPCGVVRVTVTRGSGPRGMALPPQQRPIVFATATPWLPALAFRSQRLAVSAIPRNEASPLSRIKSLAYLDNVLAFDRAVASGADDALMLSTRGRVACTSAANLFVLEGRQLITPPLDDGVLPGIMRALVLEIAPRCGLDPVERSVTLDKLRGADAVLTTNSVRLISPVVALDGRPIGREGAGTVGALSRELRAIIAQECGSALPPGPGSG